MQNQKSDPLTAEEIEALISGKKINSVPIEAKKI